MLRLALAGTVLLALTSGAAAAGGQNEKRANKAGAATAKTVTAAAADDLRGRVVDIQQTLDRILADTTPAPVGTSGAAKGATTDTQPAPAASTAVAVDRARLLQLRRQLDALLAALK